MKYTRNYSIRPSSKPRSRYITFNEAKEGVGYQDSNGDVRVKTGPNGYLLFNSEESLTHPGEVNVNTVAQWPAYTVREDSEIKVDVRLTIIREETV